MRVLRLLLATFFIWLSSVALINAEVAYNEQTLSASGGDGVAINGEWAFVGDEDACLVRIYKLDYLTMEFGDTVGNDGTAGGAGDPYQILGSNCNANGFRQFGASISNTGNTLLIGAPGASKSGVIHIYFYNPITGEWEAKTGNKGFQGPGVTDGEFGASVSIRAENENSLLVIIGAPKDGPNNDIKINPGKAFVYRFDLNSLTLSAPIKEFSGTQAQELFGYSVTSDGRRYLVGAPLYSTNPGENQGRVYYYSSTASTSPDQIYEGAVPQAQRGREVSLSAEYYMLINGNISTAYAGWEDPPSTLVKEFVGTNGGDVSQSDGVVAMSVQDTAVYVAPDINDSASSSVIITKTQTNFGEDINIYKDQLIVNGDGNNLVNAAYVYDFPCGIKPVHLNAAEWTMLSIPCDVTGKTVGDVFGNLGSAHVVTADNGDFVITEQNGTDWSGSVSANVRLSNTDIVSQDKSYWIYLRDASDWKVESSASTTRTLLTELSTFNDETIGGYKSINLQDSNVESGDNNVSVMAVNPYPRAFYWDNVYVRTAQGVEAPMNAVAASTVIKGATAYVYDLNVIDGNGQNYRAVTTTPGFTNKIEPYEGFWVTVIDDGVTPNTGVALLLPLEK